MKAGDKAFLKYVITKNNQPETVVLSGEVEQVHDTCFFFLFDPPQIAGSEEYEMLKRRNGKIRLVSQELHKTKNEAEK